MKKIGILFGMERTFPQELVEAINSQKARGVTAEFVVSGAIRKDDSLEYDVILDRVSHEIPFYRSMLKLAVINGVYVVNNPFWICMDNNFFHTALASKMNIEVPKSAILPSKEHPPGTNSDTMRNMIYPLNWDEIFDYIGFPAYIKPNVDIPTHTFFKVYNKQEFFAAYDLTGNKAMIIQEDIEWQQYYRCYVIGKKHTRIVNYDPIKPLHLRYMPGPAVISDSLRKSLEKIAIKICTVLGFDFNAIEFAVKDGVPYAIDFINPSPNLEKAFLHEENFDWIVNTTAKYLIELTKRKKQKFVEQPWLQFFIGGEAVAEKKTVRKATTRAKSRKTKKTLLGAASKDK